MKHITRFFCWALILLFAVLPGKQALATHFAAADLSLDYIGTGPNDLTYRVTLVVYKACEPNNASLSPTESFSYTSSCFAGQQFVSIPSISGPDTMDQLCPNFAPVNACRVDTSVWPAFVRYTYQTTVTFPSACTDVRVSWQGCDRNYGIQNIQCQATSTKCLYIEAGINTVAKYNNSTPRFTVDPIPYLCQNQPSFFLNVPVDPDNDSLVTVNAWPWSAFNTQIPYLGTYSLANPIASTTAYTVNPNTGTATFTPSNQGKFVLAFEATDYDKTTGTALSHVRRDVQVSVLNCNAAPPSMDTSGLQGGRFVLDDLIACPGANLTFNVTANSNTISNSVYLSSNNASVIPGSSFSVSGDGGPAPVGTFSWTPNGNDVGGYTVVFTAKDSTCNNNQPIVLKNYYIVFIKVLPGVDAGPDGRICKIDGTPWQLNASGPPSAQWQWTAVDGSTPIGLSNDTISNPTAYPPYNFEYVVTALNFSGTGCKNKDTVLVWIDTSNSVKITPDDAVVCRPGYLQLDADGIGLPPLQNLQCGTTDVVNCTTEDTLTVASQFAGPPPTPSNVYSPYQQYRSSKVQFLLTKADLHSYGIRSATLRGLAFNVTGVGTPNNITYNNFSISLKCTDRETLSSATGGMESGTTLVYSAPGALSVPLGWAQFDFDTPYSLDSTKGLIVEICYSNTNPIPAASLPQVMSVATNSDQMVLSYSNSSAANICANPATPTTTNYYTWRPQIRFNVCHATTTAFSFNWSPGDFLSDSTAKNPLAYINRNMTYIVQTVGRNGCKVQDTINILQPVRNYDIYPRDTSFCIGGSFKMIGYGDFTSIRWYEVDPNGVSLNTAQTVDCDNCSEPIATPKTDTRYAAIMTDQYGCSDTMFVNAVVRPLPVINIINHDTMIKYGQSLQLLVSGGYLYSWSPVSTLNNPNISNPYAAPTEPTTYYVWGLAENGCRNIDSVKIDIDYRDNLFVPTAFTPNGDGKNDVFRISNITFQKLQEFRVFNRWGQEIFSTTDPKKGWDGSWKGVPQDMGVYQYMIRVAYPDGYIESYKGNVTLVR